MSAILSEPSAEKKSGSASRTRILGKGVGQKMGRLDPDPVSSIVEFIRTRGGKNSKSLEACGRFIRPIVALYYL